MKPKRIRLFIKPYCGWCHKAIKWLDDRDINYHKVDVIADEASFDEMIRLSGQDLAPVIEVDGQILADLALISLQIFGQNWKRGISVPNIAEPITRPRLPEWLRIRLPTSDTFGQTRSLLNELNLHTVCESAKCPNHWECWSKGTATFMIAGDRCTRACGFCAVTTAKPLPLESDEPARVAEATHRMRLKHVVITAVARDDLKDGGAEHFRQTIEAVRSLNPRTVIEVLTPDFNDRDEAIEAVLAAKPDIFNHNLETIRRLTPEMRSRATYDRSLSVLGKVKAKRGDSIYTKSGLMLGLGETEAELIEAMTDLRQVGCQILTLGQYLQPTVKHLPVAEFVRPERFTALGDLARAMGFIHVASGALVRSSYHADEFNSSLSTR